MFHFPTLGPEHPEVSADFRVGSPEITGKDESFLHTLFLSAAACGVCVAAVNSRGQHHHRPAPLRRVDALNPAGEPSAPSDSSVREGIIGLKFLLDNLGPSVPSIAQTLPGCPQRLL